MDRAHRSRRGSLARWRIGNYVVALMVLASLLPALSSPVLAQDGGETPAGSERQGQGPVEPVESVPTLASIPTEVPPPTEVPVPTEILATEVPPTAPPPDPTAIPTEPAQERVMPTVGIMAELEPASIGLAWYLCPDDAAVPTSVTEARANSCIEFGENGLMATFDLYYGPTHAGFIQLAPMTGAGFNNLVPDNYTIRQSSPLPGTFSVFCESFQGMPYEPVPTSGGGAFIQTTPGEAIDCDWFSTIAPPSEPVEYGSSVVVRVWECSPEVGGLASATTLIEVVQLKGQCDPHHDGGLEFSLRAEGSPDIIFPIDNLVSYLFRNAPLGALELSALTTFDDAATYCSNQPHDGSGVGTPTLAGTGQTATFQIEADEDLNCDVLAVLSDGTDASTPTPNGTPTATVEGSQDTTGTLGITTRNCPVDFIGFDWLTSDVTDLREGCVDPVGDVSYTVTAGAYSQTQSIDPATDQTSFVGVPADVITIDEHPETGYTTLIASCIITDFGLPETEPSEEDIQAALENLANNRIVSPFPFPEDFEAECVWFNVPVETTTDGTPEVTPEATPTMMATVTPTLTPTMTPTATTMATATPSTPDVDVQGTPASDAGAAQADVPAELSVTASWCPGFYDVSDFGADPTVDCTELMDGATFTLDLPGAAPDLTGITGEAGPGRATFSALPAGDFTLTPSIPDPVDALFVWDCVGMSTGSVQPRPLAFGPSLGISIAGGDSIHCRWYAVPAMTQPALGSMTVVAYDCTTATYVADVECLVDNDGRVMELRVLDGSAWTTVGSGTTDGTGEVGFTSLPPGSYAIVEADTTHCLSRSDVITQDGLIGVDAGQETTVKVYTCGQLVKPPTTPTKFPNTGAPTGVTP